MSPDMSSHVTRGRYCGQNPRSTVSCRARQWRWPNFVQAELRIAFVLLVREVGEKEARQRVRDLLRRPAHRPPGPTNPEHDRELLAMVDILTKEQPGISIRQVAKDIHEAFRDRYNSADIVRTKIWRLKKQRDAGQLTSSPERWNI